MKRNGERKVPCAADHLPKRRSVIQVIVEASTSVFWNFSLDSEESNDSEVRHELEI